MQPNRIAFVTAAAALVLSASATFAQTSGAAIYDVRSLAPLPGASAAQGTAINGWGQVSGFSTVDATGATMHAVVWNGNTPQNLGTLGGPNSAIAWPNHNLFGRYAGIAETADIDKLGEAWSCGEAVFPGNPDGHVCLAFYFKDGKMNALPTLGGVNGFGSSINNLSQVVGWAETSVHDSTCAYPQVLQFKAALWEPELGKVRALAPYDKDPDSAATAINDLSQVVGISGLCSNAVGGDSAQHAVLWNPDGKPQYLGTLGGKAWNTPMAINNLGQVVGFSDLKGDDAADPNFHAFLWTKDGGMIDLGTLYHQAFSEALGINDEGVVVGVSFDPHFTNPHAFVWTREHGMVDLNTLANTNGLNLIQAQDINDLGEITGVASDPAHNTTPAFIAYPRFF